MHMNAEKQKILIAVPVFLLTAMIAGLTVFTQLQMRKGEEQDTTYKSQYMFVSQEENLFITDQIYEAAKQYGKQKGIYVDCLNTLSNQDYDTADYLKMAMAMKVDGIILAGSEEDDVRMAVNQASNMGIPVVTVLSDCTGSRRKSFITLGDYNLGRAFGRLVIDVTRTRTPKVVLLVNGDGEDSEDNKNQVLAGIRETLQNEGNHLNPEFRMEELDAETNRQIMQKIGEILMSEETKPDILICMNEKNTKMAYQSLIDYDLEGEVQIIGACESEALLNAVKDGEIAGLVHINTEQAGTLCVDALDCYIKNGSVNESVIVDDTVITVKNAERYIEDE